jgi:acyl transferase domain-containing protein
MTTHGAPDDIAIVGLSFRLPTDISSDDAFWNMLQEGRSASGAVPNDRFSLERYWHPSPDRHGTVSLPGILNVVDTLLMSAVIDQECLFSQPRCCCI